MGFTICIIGGSSLLKSPLFQDLKQAVISTKFGKVIYYTKELEKYDVIFVQRHEADPEVDYSPPHLINFRAIFSAIESLGPSFILSFCSVGSLHLENQHLQVGRFTVCNDFFAPNNIVSLSDSYDGHIVPNMDEKLSRYFEKFLEQHLQTEIAVGTTYCQATGPRFETPSEIQLFREYGDVIGMTGAHESTLAIEIKIPHVLICIVDNIANGLSPPGTSLTVEAFKQQQADNQIKFEQFFQELLQANLSNDLSHLVTSTPNLFVYDTIVQARHIVTVDEANTVLTDGAIGIKDGKIVHIFDRKVTSAEKSQAKEFLDFSQGILCPGLINAHTHSAMAYLRGFGDDLPLKEWLQLKIWPAEAKCLHPEFVRDGVELAVAEMLLGGTTCFNDMYFFPEETVSLCERIGIRCRVGALLIDFPSNYAQNTDEYFEKGEAMLRHNNPNDLVQFTVSPHDYAVSEKNLQRCSELAKKYDVPIHIHSHETKTEIKESIANQKCTPIEQFSRIGLLTDKVIAVHMTQLTDNDIALVKQSGASVVHCPTSNMKLASGFCPVQRLIDEHINVALGTDGAASNNALSMFQEMKLASLLQKGITSNAESLNATNALRMATINGAKALHLDHLVGSIEVGKSADFIILDSNSIDLLPMYNVTSHLVYVCERKHVTDVWVNGKQLVQNRTLTNIDEASLRKNCTRHKLNPEEAR